jgi:HPt (histidine-containing phosphotransfer) domain-containing protein
MDVINLEKAVRLMDGDQELFSDLFEIIENSLPEKYRNVEKALADESATDLELYAHQFKGALRNVAADEACALLERLEKCGPRKDFVQGRELFAQVPPLVDKVFAYYRSRAWVSAFEAGPQ